jgi:hypothetical protein
MDAPILSDGYDSDTDRSMTSPLASKDAKDDDEGRMETVGSWYLNDHRF